MYFVSNLLTLIISHSTAKLLLCLRSGRAVLHPLLSIVISMVSSCEFADSYTILTLSWLHFKVFSHYSNSHHNELFFHTLIL